MKTPDEKLVVKLCTIDEGLTKWEMDFIESLSEQVMDGGKVLTNKQRDVA